MRCPVLAEYRQAQRLNCGSVSAGDPGTQGWSVDGIAFRPTTVERQLPLMKHCAELPLGLVAAAANGPFSR